MSSSSGDLRPEMMESETPPSGAPSDRADEPEVSSRREPPGLAKPDSSAPTGVRLKDLLEKASISEDHHALMSMVIERCVIFTYLKPRQQTPDGIMQPAFGGRNPFNHHAHQCVVIF